MEIIFVSILENILPLFKKKYQSWHATWLEPNVCVLHVLHDNLKPLIVWSCDRFAAKYFTDKNLAALSECHIPRN